MNVNDILPEDMFEDHKFKLRTIFEKQKELMVKYHPIEMRSGLRITDECPINLHDGKGQVLIKDYAWRFTEEIGEALEAYNLHRDNLTHLREELSDALHFLTELTIHAGLTEDFLFEDKTTENPYRMELLFIQAVTTLSEDPDMPVGFRYTFKKGVTYGNLLMASGLTIESMSKACNCLKNKPWKQSQMTTDINKFNNCLKETWIRFIGLCIVAGLGEESLFLMYLNKNEVNVFRQRSKY
jgi:NTP pyrophosphatase (non-canonical NTP hydrolase)